MQDDRPLVMAATFRAWWQSLADQDPDDVAPGNTLDARQLWTVLAGIGKRNGAVIHQSESGDPTAGPWSELDPDFDWNGDIAIDADTPIDEIERATGIPEHEPLA